MNTLVCFKNSLPGILAASVLANNHGVSFVSERKLPELSRMTEDYGFVNVLLLGLKKKGYETLSPQKVVEQGTGATWFDDLARLYFSSNKNFSNYLFDEVEKARKHWKTDSPELCVKLFKILLERGPRFIRKEYHPTVSEFKRRAFEVRSEFNDLKRFLDLERHPEGLITVSIYSPHMLQYDLAEYLASSNPSSAVLVTNESVSPSHSVALGCSGMEVEGARTLDGFWEGHVQKPMRLVSALRRGLARRKESIECVSMEAPRASSLVDWMPAKL